MTKFIWHGSLGTVFCAEQRTCWTIQHFTPIQLSWIIPRLTLSTALTSEMPLLWYWMGFGVAMTSNPVVWPSAKKHPIILQDGQATDLDAVSDSFLSTSWPIGLRVLWTQSVNIFPRCPITAVPSTMLIHALTISLVAVIKQSSIGFCALLYALFQHKSDRSFLSLKILQSFLISLLTFSDYLLFQHLPYQP